MLNGVHAAYDLLTILLVAVQLHGHGLPCLAPPIQSLMQTRDIAGVATGSQSATAKPRRWGKSRPFLARVVAVEGLCQLAATDDKDTIRVEIDLGESGLQYTPGDALGVYPLNCTQVGCHQQPSHHPG